MKAAGSERKSLAWCVAGDAVYCYGWTLWLFLSWVLLLPAQPAGSQALAVFASGVFFAGVWAIRSRVIGDFLPRERPEPQGRAAISMWDYSACAGARPVAVQR